MKTRATEPDECPNPACHDEGYINLVSNEETKNMLYWVICEACQMEGPVYEDAEIAVVAWNNLARYDEDVIGTLPHPDAEDANDDEGVSEDPVTIATLVRMLDETRTFHEALKESYEELSDENSKLKNQVNIHKSNAKKNQFYYVEHAHTDEGKQYLLGALDKYGPCATSKLARKLSWTFKDTRAVCRELEEENIITQHLLQWCRIKSAAKEKTSSEVIQDHINRMALQEAVDDFIPASYMKDIQLMGKDVVPNLEKEIKELKAQLKKREPQDRVIQNYKEQLEALNKDLKYALERSHKADTMVQDHKKVLAYIDLELLKFQGGLDRERNKGNFLQVEDLVRIDTLLQDVRDDLVINSQPFYNGAQGRERIIYKIIDLVGPYGTHTNMKIYHAAVDSLAGDDKAKQDVFEMVISTFPQGGPPYNIAYDALGRPGETVHV